jgi:hypothetical protein
MIAMVRIAPLERWCEFYRKNPPAVLFPGMMVPIVTESCAVDPPCLNLSGHEPGSRWWQFPPEFVAEHHRPPWHDRICEHMLEMD